MISDRTHKKTYCTLLSAKSQWNLLFPIKTAPYYFEQTTNRSLLFQTLQIAVGLNGKITGLNSKTFGKTSLNRTFSKATSARHVFADEQYVRSFGINRWTLSLVLWFRWFRLLSFCLGVIWYVVVSLFSNHVICQRLHEVSARVICLLFTMPVLYTTDFINTIQFYYLLWLS